MSGAWTCSHLHRWHSPTNGPTATCPECGSPGHPDHVDETLPPADGAAATPLADIHIPGYELAGELGRGAMGVVYRARDEQLGRPVALKMILAGAHASPADRARFKREVAAVAALRHPNIVQIYAVGEAAGLPFCALEFVEGGTLADLAAHKPLPPDRAAAMVETVARAVQFAHDQGIVHRDLKPANVLLMADGTPKVGDFGLAKKLGSATGPTATGAVLGTPAYMAPEQAGDGKTVGPPADVYALGAILYELLTGQPPFGAATPFDTMMLVMTTDPPPPRAVNPQVPRDLETITLKCLRKEPARRYTSAGDLAADLRRWAAGEPITARPQGRGERLIRRVKRYRGWLIAGGSAAVTLLLAFLFLRTPQAAPEPSPPPAPPRTTASTQPDNFKPDVIARAMQAAAQIRVTVAGARAHGSGWCAERRANEAYIVTNAHVIGMKAPARAAPEKIEVVLAAGTPKQRQFDGTLVALDREDDLAVIRIKGPDLPAPLPIGRSMSLVESQRLLIVGFPAGAFLSRGDVTTSAKARPTSVAGRIFTRDGRVKYMQVEGGVDQGNSGAPAVDAAGVVCAVALAGVPGSNIHYMIPAEYVSDIIDGRVHDVIPGQAVRIGDGARQPLTAVVVDPLGRLKQVTADVWVGREGKIRLGGNRKPTPRNGDGPATTLTFDYDPNRPAPPGENQTVRGDVTLPPVADGNVCWFRPHYVAKDGGERWGEAVPLEMGRYPVDATPARLAVGQGPGLAVPRPVELDTRQIFDVEVKYVDQTFRNDRSILFHLNELPLAADATGGAKVRLQFRDFRLQDFDTNRVFRQQLGDVMEAVKGLRSELTLSADGRVQSARPDFANVPVAARPVLTQVHDQCFDGLASLSLPMPGKDVQPGETWPFPMQCRIDSQGARKDAPIAMTARYVGRRVRDGREEAVVELTGTIAPARPAANAADRAIVRGAALVDLATAQVTLAHIQADLDVAVPVTLDLSGLKATANVPAGVVLEMLIRRSLDRNDPKAVKAATVLPMERVTLSPWVAFERPSDK